MLKKRPLRIEYLKPTLSPARNIQFSGNKEITLFITFQQCISASFLNIKSLFFVNLCWFQHSENEKSAHCQIDFTGSEIYLRRLKNIFPARWNGKMPHKKQIGRLKITCLHIFDKHIRELSFFTKSVLHIQSQSKKRQITTNPLYIKHLLFHIKPYIFVIKQAQNTQINNPL